MTGALLTAPKLTARAQAAQEFLKFLFVPLPQDSSIEVRLKRNDEDSARRQFFGRIEDVNVESFGFDEHVWFGVALRRASSTTGKRDDLTWVTAVWADIDYYKDGASTRDQVLDKLRRFEHPPTMIVDSGGGFHVYWKLNRLMDLSQETQATYVREVVHGLAHKLGGDLRVHDLPRVLRVPGTFNAGNGKSKVYSPPRECQIVRLDPKLNYAVEDLSRHRRPIAAPAQAQKVSLPKATSPAPGADQLKTPDRLKQLVVRGWSKGCGYPSRSELDQAAMIAMLRGGHTVEEITAVWRDPSYKIGDKYREKGADGDRYLATSLAKAKEWIAGGQAQGRTLKLEDGLVKAYRASRNVWEPVYTKAIIPLSRLRGATDAWQVRVADEPPIALDSEALAGAHALKRALPPVGAWTGSDQDAQLLIPYFETHGVPEKTSVGIIGVHGDRIVFPNAILAPAGLEADSPLVYTGHYRAAELRLDDSWADLAKAIGGLLFDLHEPGAIHAIAGWFLATFAAPQIRGLTSRGFPLLNVHGSTGSGKTTLLSLLWRMAGSTRDPISIQGSTDFSRTMSLSSTNTLPIVFDEHRGEGHGLARFYASLREAYQGEEHERGRPDLTVVRLPLTSPIAIAGESALPDPALRQRALIVRLSHEMLGPFAPPSVRRQAKAALEALPLDRFNGGLYQLVRSRDVPALWHEESARAARFMRLDADDRKRFGPIVALVGLRLFEDFLRSFDPDEAARAMAGFEADEDEPSLVRLIVISMFALMQRRELKIDQDVKLEKDSMYLSPPIVLPKLAAHLRREGTALPCSEDALRDALRAEHRQNAGQGIVRDMRAGKWLGGKSNKAIELSLDAIEAAYGIDQRQWEAAAALTSPPF